jgi:hypothetical protein
MSTSAEIWVGLGLAASTALGAIGRHYAPLVWRGNNGNGNGTRKKAEGDDRPLTEREHALLCKATLSSIETALQVGKVTMDTMDKKIDRLIELRS